LFYDAGGCYFFLVVEGEGEINRESFRPFAPSVLREDVQDWF
jgi:hypothetical protein